MKKLNSNKGFTLTEVLVSLVIITMSVALLSGMVQASGTAIANQVKNSGYLYSQDANLHAKHMNSVLDRPLTDVKQDKVMILNIKKKSVDKITKIEIPNNTNKQEFKPHTDNKTEPVTSNREHQLNQPKDGIQANFYAADDNKDDRIPDVSKLYGYALQIRK